MKVKSSKLLNKIIELSAVVCRELDYKKDNYLLDDFMAKNAIR